MQRFDRRQVAPPDYFRSKEAHVARRAFMRFYLGDSETRSQTRIPERWWRISPEQGTALRSSLAVLFKGKCAFCESRAPLTIHHFRPVTEALPTEDGEQSHLYYAWLAQAWENYYAICPNCIPYREQYFPVTGKRAPLPTREQVEAFVDRGDGCWPFPIEERAVLLDPCQDDGFHKHFRAHYSGQIEGLGKRGRTTIAIYKLGRADLDKARRRRMEQYASSLVELRRAGIGAGDLLRNGMFAFEEMEFGGFWYLLLRDIALRLDPGLPSRVVAPANIHVIFGSLPAHVFAPYFSSEAPARAAAPVNTAPPDQLRHIRIEGYKAIEELDIPFPASTAGTDGAPARQGALLILGENSAGKSSILEAIALALCSAPERAGLKLDPAGLVLDPALLGADDAASTAAGPAKATVTLSFNDDYRRVLEISAQGLHCHPAQPAMPVFAYGAFRQYLAGQRRAHPARRIVSLFKSDAILSDPEAWLLGLKPEQFGKVARALRDIFSIEGEFEVIDRDLDQQRCYVIAAAGQSRSRTPLAIVSSGFRSVLGMVCEVMQGLLLAGVKSGKESFDSIRAIVLIDEVEAHLHPRWKFGIMAGLRKALPNVTYIATTHDPLCLRGVENGEAVVVRRAPRRPPNAGDLPEKIELLSGLPDLSRLSIEQLLTSDFFSLATTESPQTERELDEMVILLAREESEQGLNEDEKKQLRLLQRELADALPIGSTAVAQLIQEALADYLRKRRSENAAGLERLSATTKSRIAKALEDI